MYYTLHGILLWARRDTNDVFKKLGKTKSPPLLNSGNEAGKYLLLLGPLVLQKNQEMPQSSVIFGVTKRHVFECPNDDFHTVGHDLLRSAAEEPQLAA